MEYKVVIGTKDGKSYQKELKGEEAEALHDKLLGQTVSGEDLGFAGYEFLITGGSDKCGFPMRKGIQKPRQRIMIGGSVGYSGKQRSTKKNKNRKQNGLLKRRTVCGERVTKIIRQVNLKVTKEGSQSLGEAPAAEVLRSEASGTPEAKPQSVKEEAPKEE